MASLTLLNKLKSSAPTSLRAGHIAQILDARILLDSQPGLLANWQVIRAPRCNCSISRTSRLHRQQISARETNSILKQFQGGPTTSNSRGDGLLGIGEAVSSTAVCSCSSQSTHLEVNTLLHVRSTHPQHASTPEGLSGQSHRQRHV